MNTRIHGKQCCVDGCDKPRVNSRHCSMHCNRIRRGSKDGLAPSRLTCMQCGAALSLRKQKFCSHQCCVRFHRGTPETRSCIVCQSSFKTWDRGTICSPECKKKNLQINNNIRRARTSGPGSEKFDPLEIFIRDEWVCQLCGQPTDGQVKIRNPFCATLDHITPLSRGGLHTRLNSQCAHRICNERKRDKLPSELKMVAA